ncbi:Nucleotide-binding universal stress protein, UspA family [Sinomicrobium oceani]|uniref:Nucleotide-binding universal stress protein, UspA family n=1 Tax=Sinomicrobium oceani TaxID=1150368 RepID=A0A1K1R3I0_9FLAO|nr:universal stress protein [Sinomicrobium oceani]SFW66473.1 Nucleotide-binding universal stress protein, UspA family [Sinomicrobium oceani]
MITEIKNILVALDLSEIDDTLIAYASFLSDVLQADKVYFVHNIKKYEISELFEDKLGDVNIEESIGEELNEKVSVAFTGKAEWEVLISNDSYTESLIAYIVNKYAIHLTLVGSKNRVKGTGVVSGKLLRMLRCHILSIPRATPPRIEYIRVGTDFSSASRRSFTMAQVVGKAALAAVKAVHIYNVPLQFAPYLPKETLVPVVEKHTAEKGRKFMKKIPGAEDIPLEIIPGRSSSISETLIEYGKKQKTDLFFVSDKGGNTFSSLLVGSVTEELFNEDLHFPLWVCR